jgi:hypothetical protein
VNKKEAKKTLIPAGIYRAGVTHARSGAKVFLVLFFQKKNCLLACRKPWMLAF